MCGKVKLQSLSFFSENRNIIKPQKYISKCPGKFSFSVITQSNIPTKHIRLNILFEFVHPYVKDLWIYVTEQPTT